jgi:pimeloyl-ACP methyl ester carboxylesterase
LSLSFREFGNGQTIVLMHGLFGSGDNLQALARGLGTHHRIVLPDLPNHGSSPHIDRSTHGALADAAEEFLEDQGLGNVMIGGYSLGGKIAMLLALRRPERYSGLISIDMAPRRYQASHLEIMAAMRDLPLAGLGSRRDADEALSPAIPEPDVRSFLLKNLVRDGERFRWRLNLDAITADYEAMLGWQPPDATFAGPALFVGGERSRYLQADRDAAGISRLFPNAEIHMIADAGHWLHVDKPAELLAVVSSFLSGLGAS